MSKITKQFDIKEYHLSNERMIVAECMGLDGNPFNYEVNIATFESWLRNEGMLEWMDVIPDENGKDALQSGNISVSDFWECSQGHICEMLHNYIVNAREGLDETKAANTVKPIRQHLKDIACGILPAKRRVVA